MISTWYIRYINDPVTNDDDVNTYAGSYCWNLHCRIIVTINWRQQRTAFAATKNSYLYGDLGGKNASFKQKN